MLTPAPVLVLVPTPALVPPTVAPVLVPVLVPLSTPTEPGELVVPVVAPVPMPVLPPTLVPAPTPVDCAWAETPANESAIAATGAITRANFFMRSSFWLLW